MAQKKDFLSDRLSISGVVVRLCRAFPFLTGCWIAVTVLFVLLNVLSFGLMSPNSLFIIDAKTTRIQFQPQTPTFPNIPVSGVNLQNGDFFLQAFSAENNGEPLEGPQSRCFLGEIAPRQGTIVELDVINGQQFMRLNAAPAADTGEAVAGTVQSLDRTWKFYQFSESKIREEAPRSQFDLGAGPKELPLQNIAMATGSADCADTTRFKGNDGRPISFAPKIDPISIDGAATLGRGVRFVVPKDAPDVPTVIDLGDEVISGNVQVMVRQSICLRSVLSLPIRILSREWPLHSNCENVYKLQSDALTIPTGTAIRGLERRWFWQPRTDGNTPATRMFGQVHFDGEMYQVSLSTGAKHLEIIYNWGRADAHSSDLLSISFFDRARAEPWLILITSLFITMTGLIVGILQIEDLRPAKKVSPAQRRPTPQQLAHRIKSQARKPKHRRPRR